MKIQVGNLTLIGGSVAGKCTAISIPQLHLTFDLGYLPEASVQTDFILVSHGHQDHLSALCLHQRQRRLRKMSKPTYILPKVCHELFKQWLQLQLALDAGQDQITQQTQFSLTDYLNLKISEDYQLPDQTLKLQGRYYLTSFPTHHRVPSVGYLITEQRKKLRSEYSHLTSREFGQLITSTPGPDRGKFFDLIEVPLVCYTGDTIFEHLLDKRATPLADKISQVEVLICECTYLQDKSRDKAHKYGHTHIDEILEAKESGLLQCQHLVLFHFSASYFDYRSRDQPTMIRELLEEIDFYEKMKPIQIHLFDRPPF